MIIEDIAYGKEYIDEKVLLDLLNSKAVARIKSICNQGVPKEFLADGEPDYSRYDHSTGVMIVLRRIGANVEEQAAGLLHDVSHTAFSHVADYVIGSGTEENYQDNMHSKYFAEGTELYEILKSNDMDPKRIAEPMNFGLLERDQPYICADRVDNSVRHMAHLKNTEFLNLVVPSIMAHDGYMAFTNIDAAREFAYAHEAWLPEVYGYGGLDADMDIRYYILGSAIKIAMKEGAVTKEDFELTDSEFLEKLDSPDIKEVETLLDFLRSNRKKILYETTDKDPKVILYSKFRYVDPFFIKDNKLIRLSEAEPSYRERIERNRALNKKGVKLSSVEGLEIPIIT